MEIRGLPLHALAVHAAVVLGPLGALSALAYTALPRARELLRWPMVGLALVATGAIVVAYLSGDSYLASRPELEQAPLVQTHRARAEVLLPLTVGFGAVALLTGVAHGRTRTGSRLLLLVLLAAAALAVLVQVVLTGEAGARSVWGALDARP
ncbi:MAG TPA: DUF2231 domain-containing protein [Nocardioides sp.]|nr:DUF2231 domain-containing protein [Nocardioides sp.]